MSKNSATLKFDGNMDVKQENTVKFEVFLEESFCTVVSQRLLVARERVLLYVIFCERVDLL